MYGSLSMLEMHLSSLARSSSLNWRTIRHKNCHHQDSYAPSEVYFSLFCTTGASSRFMALPMTLSILLSLFGFEQRWQAQQRKLWNAAASFDELEALRHKVNG